MKRETYVFNPDAAIISPSGEVQPKPKCSHSTKETTMTIDERAVALCKEILYGDPDPRTVSSIAAAIREAVAEAYQTCARIAENAEKVSMGHAEVAAAIRARATHPEPPPAANPPPQPPRPSDRE